MPKGTRPSVLRAAADKALADKIDEFRRTKISEAGVGDAVYRPEGSPGTLPDKREELLKGFTELRKRQVTDHENGY